MREKMKLKTVSVVVFVLLISIMVTAVNSYYTDHHSKMNVFTTGKVSIELNEPKYNSLENIKTRESLAPGEEIIKDPVITNTGKSDCFVFAEVKIPRSNRIFIDSNGKKLPVMLRNLFDFEGNSGWTLYSKSINDNHSKPYESYIFSYSDGNRMTTLSPGEKTSSIIKNNKMKFANVIETDNFSKYEIPVTAYAIQTTDLLVSENGKVSPGDVYKAIYGQLRAERN